MDAAFDKVFAESKRKQPNWFYLKSAAGLSGAAAAGIMLGLPSLPVIGAAALGTAGVWAHQRFARSEEGEKRMARFENLDKQVQAKEKELSNLKDAKTRKILDDQIKEIENKKLHELDRIQRKIEELKNDYDQVNAGLQGIRELALDNFKKRKRLTKISEMYPEMIKNIHPTLDWNPRESSFGRNVRELLRHQMATAIVTMRYAGREVNTLIGSATGSGKTLSAFEHAALFLKANTGSPAMVVFCSPGNSNMQELINSCDESAYTHGLQDEMQIVHKFPSMSSKNALDKIQSKKSDLELLLKENETLETQQRQMAEHPSDANWTQTFEQNKEKVERNRKELQVIQNFPETLQKTAFYSHGNYTKESLQDSALWAVTSTTKTENGITYRPCWIFNYELKKMLLYDDSEVDATDLKRDMFTRAVDDTPVRDLYNVLQKGGKVTWIVDEVHEIVNPKNQQFLKFLMILVLHPRVRVVMISATPAGSTVTEEITLARLYALALYEFDDQVFNRIDQNFAQKKKNKEGYFLHSEDSWRTMLQMNGQIPNMPTSISYKQLMDSITFNKSTVYYDHAALRDTKNSRLGDLVVNVPDYEPFKQEQCPKIHQEVQKWKNDMKPFFGNVRFSVVGSKHCNHRPQSKDGQDDDLVYMGENIQYEKVAKILLKGKRGSDNAIYALASEFEYERGIGPASWVFRELVKYVITAMHIKRHVLHEQGQNKMVRMAVMIEPEDLCGPKPNDCRVKLNLKRRDDLWRMMEYPFRARCLGTIFKRVMGGDTREIRLKQTKHEGNIRRVDEIDLSPLIESVKESTGDVEDSDQPTKQTYKYVIIYPLGQKAIPQRKTEENDDDLENPIDVGFGDFAEDTEQAKRNIMKYKNRPEGKSAAKDIDNLNALTQDESTTLTILPANQSFSQSISIRNMTGLVVTSSTYVNDSPNCMRLMQILGRILRLNIHDVGWKLTKNMSIDVLTDWKLVNRQPLAPADSNEPFLPSCLVSQLLVTALFAPSIEYVDIGLEYDMDWKNILEKTRDGLATKFITL